MKYLIDTNIVIDHFKGKSTVVSFLQKASQYGIAISVISVGEILEGLIGQPHENKRRNELEEFLLAVKILEVDVNTVQIFARVRSDLRTKGEMINNFDIIIAATAINRNLTLISEDKGFERIKGLKLKYLSENYL